MTGIPSAGSGSLQRPPTITKRNGPAGVSQKSPTSVASETCREASCTGGSMRLVEPKGNPFTDWDWAREAEDCARWDEVLG